MWSNSHNVPDDEVDPSVNSTSEAFKGILIFAVLALVVIIAPLHFFLG